MKIPGAAGSGAARTPVVAVGVSGTGTTLRALLEAESTGVLGGRIGLVFADRPCPAIELAHARGITTLVVEGLGSGDPGRRSAAEEELVTRLRGDDVRLIVLAGFMRVLGSMVVEAFRDRILNTHPSLLPAFPGAHAVRDALAHGVHVTGATVHLVDETLDGGPIVLQEPVPVLPGDDEGALHERIKTVERRLVPRAVALALAGALDVSGRHVRLDPGRAATLPRRRRALLSVSDKRGLVSFAADLRALGFELVSTGGTARTLREAGLAVVDVAAVTGFPEMLDGRVKTLHPRVAAGVLADLRRAAHAEALAAAGIEPFELLCVNLYRFADAAARPDAGDDELIEEIDIGGPTMVRAAAKNHSSVAIVTDPEQYAVVVDELRREGSLGPATRRRLALAAFRLTAEYDATISAVLAGRAAADDPDAALERRFPERLAVALRRGEHLRYGENPHQAAALYVSAAPGMDGLSAGGPFSRGVVPLAGKPLSYNNLLDAAAAAALARDLRGPAVAIIKHTNPCGAAEAADLPTAWERALEADPVSAFGGVVAVRGTVDQMLAERLSSLFLEVVIAAGFEARGLERLASRPGLRLLAWPGILEPSTPSLELRSAGGAVLVTDADTEPDERTAWRPATTRLPDDGELSDLDLAWRVCRHVKSNAIVLARGGAVVGVGAGQMSRVESARLAVARAGAERARGAACASDAFFPFPDAVEECLAAGVRAFVQPGGSQRDAEVVAAAESAGAAMLMTGTRHFRH